MYVPTEYVVNQFFVFNNCLKVLGPSYDVIHFLSDLTFGKVSLFCCLSIRLICSNMYVRGKFNNITQFVGGRELT